MIASRTEVLRRLPIVLLGTYAWAATFLERPTTFPLLAFVPLGALVAGVAVAREEVLRLCSLFGFVVLTALVLQANGPESPLGLPWYGWLGWFGFALTWGLTPPVTDGIPSRSPLPPRRVVSRWWGALPLVVVGLLVALAAALREVPMVERHLLALTLVLGLGALLMRATLDALPAVDLAPRSPLGFRRLFVFAACLALSVFLWVAG